ncbi:MAG: glycine zipper 2TM domain-containing protein [Rhodoferax sp.]|nr:glycine zipper 2TM domain-containing protein [Rhodoferax sp.]
MSHAMSLPGSPNPQSRSQRWLWVGLGALVATTLAMGAALVQVYHRSADEVAPAIPLTPVSAVAATVEALPPLELVPEPVVKPAVTKPPSKVAKAHTRSTPIASKSVATTSPSTQVAAAPLMCAQCGRVEAVTPFQREAKASGVGAVAGAVLGGLVGNQFGGGDGKTVATIAGALGGGWAGNTVEKKMKSETVYRVDVRMENGSLRTLEQTQPVAVGSRVTVDGTTLRSASAPAQTL